MNTALLSTGHWERVGELFDRLSALPANERNLQALDEPAAIIDILSRMLAAHDSDDPQLLDRTIHALAGHLLGDDAASGADLDHTGRLFGPWRALEEIGRGGMAVVLRGKRADGQFEKEVALKLLPRAGNAAERDRLHQEMRILARLEHASIARLIDGGIDDDGTPYLVMEYVRGVPITEYCESHKLDLKSRIRLFQQVTEAVRFAHQHLIVHCDIKPDNVLVSDDGQVKLVDFGIAGLITTGTRARAVSRGLLCSPGYCAPEQMKGAPPATSQDIYNLGAVLYELLCGQRIRANQTATRLLLGAGNADETIPPLSHCRKGMDPDLEAICAKALSREPEQRYASADTLLSDLHNWRSRQPVTARRGGWMYHSRKWLQRNRWPATMGGLALAALLTGLGAALWQAERAGLEAERAHQEAERATTIKDFLLSLFRAGDPLRVGGPVLDTREVLRLGAERIREDQSLSLPIRIEILNTIADVQRTLDQDDDARAFLEEALALAKTGEGASPLQHAETLHQLGVLESVQSNFDQATERFDQALAAIPDDGAPASEHLRARALIQRGGVKARNGRVPDAEADLEQAEAIVERMDPPDLELAMLVANTKGVAAYHTARYEEAFEHLQTTAELHRQMGNEQQAPMVQTLSSLAAIATMLGRLDLALEYDRESVSIARNTFPEGHQQIGNALFALGDTLRQLGRFDEAEERLAEARAIQEAGGNQAEIQLIDRTLLRVLIGRGDYDQAAELAARVRPAMEERWGRNSRFILLMLEVEITAAWHAGNSAQLQRAVVDAEERLENLSDTDRWVPLAQTLRWRLGHLAWLQQDFERARQWSQQGAQAPEDSSRHPTPELLLAGLRLRLPVSEGDTASLEDIDYARDMLEGPEAAKATAHAIAYAWCSLVMAYRHSGDEQAASIATAALRDLQANDQRLTAEALAEIEAVLNRQELTSTPTVP